MKEQFHSAARRRGTKFWPVHVTVKPRMRANNRAFTRTELVATLAAVFLLGAVALPMLAGSKPRSERMLCLNNLRQIGVAFNSWASDHADSYPFRVPTASGGVQGAPFAGNAWYQFFWLSNELFTPKVLVCPSDSGKRMASTWGSELSGGFLHSLYRNYALSYVVGLDAFSDNPNHVLSGDRNMDNRGRLSGCSAGPIGVPTFQTVPPDPATKWTDSIHFSSGNALLTDGRALELSNQGLRDAMKSSDDNGDVHFLLPN